MTGYRNGITVWTIGMARAAFNVGLTNLIYNICRYSIISRKTMQGISSPKKGKSRQNVVAMRRGFNNLAIPKWKAFLDLKDYFDKKTGIDIYKLIGV